MNDIEIEERKSKSQRKREMLALQGLGQQLVRLSDSNLNAIPMPEELRSAVLAAKTFQREALRRQLQHIGGLMREVDADAIRRALDAISQPHREKTQEFHEVERWRDALIEGDDALLEEIMSQYISAGRQHLRQLARSAKKEREQNKPPKSARALFRYLFELRSEEQDKI
jgi:ribosome-associated protein